MLITKSGVSLLPSLLTGAGDRVNTHGDSAAFSPDASSYTGAQRQSNKYLICHRLSAVSSCGTYAAPSALHNNLQGDACLRQPCHREKGGGCAGRGPAALRADVRLPAAGEPVGVRAAGRAGHRAQARRRAHVLQPELRPQPGLPQPARQLPHHARREVVRMALGLGFGVGLNLAVRCRLSSAHMHCAWVALSEQLLVMCAWGSLCVSLVTPSSRLMTTSARCLRKQCNDAKKVCEQQQHTYVNKSGGAIHISAFGTWTRRWMHEQTVVAHVPATLQERDQVAAFGHLSTRAAHVQVPRLGFPA